MGKYDFVAGYTGISDERIAEIAKNNKVSFNDVQHITLDCAYNTTADNHTIERLFNEYQNNGEDLQKWFDSYVVDCVIDEISYGFISEQK